MNKLLFVAAVAMLISSQSYAETMTLDEISEMNKKSESTEEGMGYKKSIVKQLFSKNKFMKVCAPPGGPKANPFFMFFKIETDGTVSLFKSVPVTDTSTCIKKEVLSRIFEKPKEPYMFGLHMVFN